MPRSEIFGDLTTADHKVSSEGCESRHNHRHVAVVQDLGNTMDAHLCKTKTAQETKKSFQKFLEPNRKPKVIYTDNSLEFGKACEELSWNHCTSTPHRSETNGIAERASTQSERRDVCSIVAIRSGQRMVDGFYGMLHPICETFKISLSDGKTPYERRLWSNHVKVPLFHLVHWLSITQSLREGPYQESHQFGKKVLPGYIPWIRSCHAGGIWKG